MTTPAPSRTEIALDSARGMGKCASFVQVSLPLQTLTIFWGIPQRSRQGGRDTKAAFPFYTGLGLVPTPRNQEQRLRRAVSHTAQREETKSGQQHQAALGERSSSAVESLSRLKRRVQFPSHTVSPLVADDVSGLVKRETDKRALLPHSRAGNRCSETSQPRPSLSYVYSGTELLLGGSVPVCFRFPEPF